MDDLLRKISMTVLLTLLVFSVGCTQDSAEESHHHEVELGEISPGELNDELSHGKILLVDVRDEEDFESGHIPSAVNLPLEKMSMESVNKLGVSNRELVVYHKSSGGGNDAKRILNSLGFDEVVYLNGGITHWMEDGFKLQEGSVFIPEKDLKESDEGPKISFDRKLHNFGKIRQFGGNVSANFTVGNLGNETLKIGEITTSCGCTAASITEKIIEPGGTAVLIVLFNPNLHEEPLGEFSRTVFIPSNDPNVQEAEVKITVDIIEGE